MTVVLFRVDERLIHGQVVIGWKRETRPDRYVIVDDELAGSEWEQELYLLALPEHVSADFLDVDGALERIEAMERSDERIVLLTRDLDTMLHLAADGGLEGRHVNLGGIHHAEGRTRIRPYLHLDDADRARIRELRDAGVTVSARDLPGSQRVGVDSLLRTG